MENRAIINEIYRTIMKAGIIPLSWGINTFKATWYRGMPTLKFHVNGFMHKGDVAVCLNRGTDLYDIFLFGKNNHVTFMEGIGCEALVSALDSAIETDDPTSKEYGIKVRKFLFETLKEL
ncbi:MULTISPECIES: hypothetical protein [Bacteroides]|jgi:hypothetical protein|uniref:hypothetical protein n=1 Tax=Bacteroides TaxID=816 RepID=UPI0006ACF9E5|nr:MULTISPECIES: hypothetical protein [Bacteroides]MCM0362338.1 hypothetical protein [Bacteroides fragilis]QCQ56849.1 hypothetical protein EC81_024415 [Bacteroides fragilis]WLG15810.1 hypothetical protein [Bacteroides sp.]